MKTKKTTVFESEDGRTFPSAEECRAYESGQALVVYLNSVLPETAMADVAAIVEAIRADPVALAEAIKPLLPKRTRADKGMLRGRRAARGASRAA